MPLMILAVGSIFTGWLGAPEYLWGSRWDRWLEPIFGVQATSWFGEHARLSVTLITLAVVAVGIYAGLPVMYRQDPSARAGWQHWRGVLYSLLLNKYYVDEFYDFIIVRPFTAVAKFLCAHRRSLGDRWHGQWRRRHGARFQHDLARPADRQRAALRARCSWSACWRCWPTICGQLYMMSAQVLRRFDFAARHPGVWRGGCFMLLPRAAKSAALFTVAL